jgi:hypothetical protein
VFNHSKSVRVVAGSVTEFGFRLFMYIVCIPHLQELHFPALFYASRVLNAQTFREASAISVTRKRNILKILFTVN